MGCELAEDRTLSSAASGPQCACRERGTAWAPLPTHERDSIDSTVAAIICLLLIRFILIDSPGIASCYAGVCPRSVYTTCVTKTQKNRDIQVYFHKAQN